VKIASVHDTLPVGYEERKEESEARVILLQAPYAARAIRRAREHAFRGIRRVWRPNDALRVGKKRQESRTRRGTAHTGALE
jgi:hypothetical protein